MPAPSGTARTQMIKQFRTRNVKRKGTRITEDDPRWNASTMGNKSGWHKGSYYTGGKVDKTKTANKTLSSRYGWGGGRG